MIIETNEHHMTPVQIIEKRERNLIITMILSEIEPRNRNIFIEYWFFGKKQKILQEMFGLGPSGIHNAIGKVLQTFRKKFETESFKKYDISLH